MKLGRPVYIKELNVYTCECKDEKDIFRIESLIEGGIWNPVLASFIDSKRDEMIAFLLQETVGWFSKPLSREWLLTRLEFTIPTCNIPNEFEGTCIWKIGKVNIYKEKFVCEFVLSDTVSKSISLIDLQEEAPIPVVDSKRKEKKDTALRARQRAALALLKAERLMHAYAEEFGEDTEWEEEEEEEE